MNNPIEITANDIIVDFTSEKGEITADVSGTPTANYKYCFMGIKLTPATVLELKAAMQPGSQFYVEIMFKDVLNNIPAAESKYVHQFFDYDVLIEQPDDLELKMTGYYELPISEASTTSVLVEGAKLYYADPLPVA